MIVSYINQLRSYLSHEDVRSGAFLRGVTIAVFILISLIMVTELMLDLHSTNIYILTPLWSISLIAVICEHKNWYRDQLRILLVFLIYSATTIHLVIKPGSLHVLIFWMPFAPFAALIIHGLRASIIWLAISILSIIVCGINAYIQIGNSYPVEIHIIPFLASGLIFVIAILTFAFLLYILLAKAYHQSQEKSKGLNQLRQEVSERNQTLAQYQQNLLELTRDEQMFQTSLEYLFQRISQVAATSLGVSRVGIWALEEHNQKLVRRYLYEEMGGTDERLVLKRKDFTPYFEALENKPYIMADNAHLHPDTAIFTDTYLKPLEIFSMLDCPIIIDGEAIGVICCEHQREHRAWEREDALFIQSLADLISIGYKNERIKGLLNKIQQQHRELLQKNDEIGEVNMDLRLMNETLEETVKKRTLKLATQNEKLIEYAFINSHILRAPLARVLGLIELLSYQERNPEEEGFFKMLKEQAEEIDRVSRKISKLLYESKAFTQEDVNQILQRTNLN